MDLQDWFKAVITGLIIVLACTFFTVCFLPKTHQGYYMGVLDGRNSNQIYPVYAVYSNWKYFPDYLVYESLSASDCFEMYKKLKGEGNEKEVKDGA